MLVCCIFRVLCFFSCYYRGVGVEMAKMLSVVDSRHVVGVLFGWFWSGFWKWLWFFILFAVLPFGGFLGFFRCGRNYIFGAFFYWIKNGHSIILVWTVNCCEIRTWIKVFFCSFVLHFCTCLAYGPVTFAISQFPSFRGACVLLWFDMTVVKPSPQGGKGKLRDWFWPTGRGHRSGCDTCSNLIG